MRIVRNLKQNRCRVRKQFNFKTSNKPTSRKSEPAHFKTQFEYVWYFSMCFFFVSQTKEKFSSAWRFDIMLGKRILRISIFVIWSNAMTSPSMVFLKQVVHDTILPMEKQSLTAAILINCTTITHQIVFDCCLFTICFFFSFLFFPCFLCDGFFCFYFNSQGLVLNSTMEVDDGI